MRDERLDVLVDRLDQLEQENRRLRRQRPRKWWTVASGGIALALAVVVGAGLARAPRTFEAERFILRDAKGRIRAEWNVKEEGVCQTLFDESGKPRLRAMVAPDGSSGLGFYDNNNKVRLGLSLESDGAAGLGVLAKGSDKPKIDLSVQPTGEPTLSFFDKNDKPRVSVVVQPTGEPSLDFFDEIDSLRASIVIGGPENTAEFTLYDKAQKEVFHAPPRKPREPKKEDKAERRAMNLENGLKRPSHP